MDTRLRDRRGNNKKSSKNAYLFVGGLALVTTILVLGLTMLASKVNNVDEASGSSSLQLPLTRFTNTEHDFLPNFCHKFLVHKFPTLTSLLAKKKGSDMGKSGGAWSACTHVKIYGMNFMPFLARHIAYTLQPQSVLEFGCGLGTMSDFLARFVPSGSKVVCVEPEAMLGEVFGGKNGGNNVVEDFSHDVSILKPFPFRPVQLAMYTFAPQAKQCADALFHPKMKFELVISLEVAEHVPTEYHPELIHRLSTATTKYLVFAAARPLQKGTGHIDASMHDASWWMEQFAKQGLTLLPQLTLAMRWMTARPERAYDLGANLIVMGAPGVKDITQVPQIAHDCFYNPTILGGIKELTEQEKSIAAKQHIPASAMALQIPECPLVDHEIRKQWVEGQQQALWPELDLLIRRVQSGQIHC